VVKDPVRGGCGFFCQFVSPDQSLEAGQQAAFIAWSGETKRILLNFTFHARSNLGCVCGRWKSKGPTVCVFLALFASPSLCLNTAKWSQIENVAVRRVNIFILAVGIGIETRMRSVKIQIQNSWLSQNVYLRIFVIKFKILLR